MHGNILDANSTNKLINQSVKDAVDDKFIESEYLIKDLLEAEASARTKGDEDLGDKIKEEQTRAEGKEKEISDKLAIVDGDSNTEGSFRKAISAKQDAGNYIPYDDQYKQVYIPDRTLRTRGNNIEAYSNGSGNDRSILQPGNILVEKTDGNMTHTAKLNIEGLTIRNAYKDIYIDEDGFRIFDATGNNGLDFIIQKQGITLKGGDDSHVLTSNSGTIDITQYALKTELPTVPTKTSQLTNDSNFASADDVSSLRADLSRKQDRITVNEVDITDIETAGITKLRTILTNLINALSESGLIRLVETPEQSQVLMKA